MCRPAHTTADSGRSAGSGCPSACACLGRRAPGIASFAATAIGAPAAGPGLEEYLRHVGCTSIISGASPRRQDRVMPRVPYRRRQTEHALGGGNVAAGVVRVGDTVRKPAGFWMPGRRGAALAPGRTAGVTPWRTGRAARAGRRVRAERRAARGPAAADRRAYPGHGRPAGERRPDRRAAAGPPARRGSRCALGRRGGLHRAQPACLAPGRCRHDHRPRGSERSRFVTTTLLQPQRTKVETDHVTAPSGLGLVGVVGRSRRLSELARASRSSMARKFGEEGRGSGESARRGVGVSLRLL